MEPLYVPGRSWLHRCRATHKLALLALLSAGLFFVQDWRGLAPAAVVAWLVLASVRVPPARLWRQLRMPLLMVGLVAVALGLLQSWPEAGRASLRLLALLAFAYAVTFSTRTSDLLEACERLLQPLSRLGWVHAGSLALAVGLALRFIPELARHYQLIREAQLARGLERRPLATLLPLLIAVLRDADVVADAIDARGYPPPARHTPGHDAP